MQSSTKKLVIQHVARWHTFHTMVFVKTFHVFASTLLKILNNEYTPFDISHLKEYLFQLYFGDYKCLTKLS